MSRIAYVNGRYLPFHTACVHVEDRGYQFADGVYEVIAIHGGRLVDAEPHLDRLDYSLSEMRMSWPMERGALRVVMAEMLRRNRIAGRGCLYIQATRGVAPRNHAFPAGTRPSLVMTARSLPPINARTARQGVRIITIPDIRWKRPDIKSISLLPNVLGKQQALDAGAFDAWMVDERGFVTEGTASNAWIVSSTGGELVTRQPDRRILNGITRQVVLRIASERGLALVERPFRLDEALAASEGFLTSTTSLVKPVIRIDDHVIGDGGAGPLTCRLIEAYTALVGEPWITGQARDPGEPGGS